MDAIPFGFEALAQEARLGEYNAHLRRSLSELADHFSDLDAYRQMLRSGDPLVYEVYEVQRPAIAGELMMGLSVVHPGRVGTEFFMTKGHFHLERGTGEVYYCLSGFGLLLLQDQNGRFAAEELRPGRVVYAPPFWAHRSVNTGQGSLVTLFIYPANAGHDYESIRHRGFRRLVVERAGGYELVDNPVWAAPAHPHLHE